MASTRISIRIESLKDLNLFPNAQNGTDLFDVKNDETEEMN
jgi:hypothetical protein